MASKSQPGGLFPALLKHWRRERALSQLDLALAADVSARHVSFLETGRATPSSEMVLRLSAALSIPMREQNTLLRAAGFEPHFTEPKLGQAMGEGPQRVLQLMMHHHEPFPMLIMNRTYQLLLANRGANALLGAFVAEPSALTTEPNVVRLLFDPRLVRPFVDNWTAVARALVARLHRESLLAPHDQGLNDLLQSLFRYEGVPQDFRHPDVTEPIAEALAVRLKRGPLQVSLLSTLTVFSAPHNITLEDLRVESYFPTDDDSAETCRALANAPV